jgi:hypothetical protein
VSSAGLETVCHAAVGNTKNYFKFFLQALMRRRKSRFKRGLPGPRGRSGGLGVCCGPVSTEGESLMKTTRKAIACLGADPILKPAHLAVFFNQLFVKK